jgi:hypothetical protein
MSAKSWATAVDPSSRHAASAAAHVAFLDTSISLIACCDQIFGIFAEEVNSHRKI